MVISQMGYDPKNETFSLKVLTLFDNFQLLLPSSFLLCLWADWLIGLC
jgi:hypothetical protein